MQTRRAVWIATALCLVPGVTLGQTITISPQLRSMVIGWTRLTFVSGRIINAGQWPMTRSTHMSGDGTKEEIVFDGNGATGSMRYHRESKTQDFQLDVNSEGRFHFRWHDAGQDKSDVELIQNPNDLVTLSVDVAGKKKVIQGNTFWNIWIADPELCRKRVAPILETLRPGWSVASNGASVETELLRLAAAGQHSDRKQWSAWVDQLADPQFMKREKADKELRAAGPPVLGFLRQINSDQLDAEQQSRLQHIIRLLTRQTAEDTPEQIAQTLIEDPLVWLALLGRSEESTRRTAANQLAVILGEKIRFDPAVAPDKQTAVLDELRARLDRNSGSGRAKENKDAAKPQAAGNDEKTPRPAAAPATK